MGDKRRDSGEYYPGGRVIARPGKAPQQIVVQWTDVQGKPQIAPLPDRYRESDMKGKINEIASKFATAIAVALVGWTALAGLVVQKAQKDQILNNEEIVTNVYYEGEQIVDTNAVTNIIHQTVDKAYVESLGISGGGGSGGTNTNDVKALINSEVGGTNAVKDAVAAVANKADSQKDGYKGSIGTVFLTPNGDRYGVNYAENANYAKEADDATFAYRAGAVEWQGIENKPDIPTKSDVLEAKAYARETYEYMTGNTNAWFAGTNYVVGADAETRHRFAWEDGMDAETVPCSMALWEIREGRKQVVWDQRDWTAWYWSFKSGQMRGEIAAAKAEVYAVVTNDETHAWAKHYAATGRRNPDASTTFIDTQSVTLSLGMAWETVATVGGCGYWTIVGNGAVIGGSGTNATLNIKDFEGNSILEITKGQHMLAWLDSSDFVGQLTDSDGWICFDMMADVKPTGYFSTTLVAADFVAETDANCPAQYRWEDLGGGVWRVHFLLKPGIVARECFAKFQVEVEGKTQIRHNADTVINGGLIFNGVKIAPVVTPGAAAGTSVEWKVVP